MVNAALLKILDAIDVIITALDNSHCADGFPHVSLNELGTLREIRNELARELGDD